MNVLMCCLIRAAVWKGDIENFEASCLLFYFLCKTSAEVRHNLSKQPRGIEVTVCVVNEIGDSYRTLRMGSCNFAIVFFFFIEILGNPELYYN
jgi:hypothetical protein